jgi:HSP20 family protein
MTDESKTPSSGLVGLLRNLEGFVERLEEATEEKGGVHRRVSFGDEEDLRGEVEFRVRTAFGGGASARSRRPRTGDAGAADAGAAEPAAEEPREPVVDVRDEGDRVCIVAEMPGVAADEVDLDVGEAAVHLGARGARRYRAEVALPRPVDADRASLSVANGIVEVAVPYADAPNDQAPNDQAPNDQAPNDQAPNDQAPNDQAPA